MRMRIEMECMGCYTFDLICKHTRTLRRQE